MTKGEIIDTVLIRINGGVLNSESAVWRVDLEAYIPAAVNYALVAMENIQIKDEGDREMPGDFVACYELPIQYNEDRRVDFVALTVAPIAFRSNRGIRLIIDNCNHTYAPMRETGVSGINKILKYLGHKGLYWYQGNNDIFIYNKPKLANRLFVYIIKNVKSYAMDDELPIPAGMEADVMNIMYEYFTGQRQVPADRKSDQRDLN
jgi:hypothetical protein